MKASGIFNHENAFQNNGIDSSGKKFILTDETVTIPTTGESLTIVDCKRENNDDSFYFKDIFTKKKIILHYTAGYLKGDIATLTTNHVSVPFVIGRNGKIYNLFASKYCSFHLGPGASGGNTAMSKSTIGIELSNIGPLKKIGNHLVSTYRDDDVYCSLDETDYYTHLPNAYKNYNYFATFTNAQYESLILLLKFLTEKYNIPKTMVTLSDRYSKMTDSVFTNYNGIASHVNCRTDKTDIGPAFDWDRIVQGIGV